MARKASVDDLRTHIDHESANQARIDGEINFNGPAADHGLNLGGQRCLLGISQGLSRADMSQRDLAGFAVKLEIPTQDGIKSGEAVAIGQDLEEIQ